MYTKVGRILRKQEAQKFYNMIRMVIDDLQIHVVQIEFSNPAISTKLKVTWERNEPSLVQGWESLSVVHKHQFHNGEQDELFDTHHTFAEAYGLNVV
jgi:hypothetical protein